VGGIAVLAAVAGLLCSCSGSGSSAAPGSTAARVYPLTGTPSGTGGNASRPALSIKVDNAAPAHPQTGLDAADIVSEQLVEGGLTRLLAVYQSTDATTVGPIRSARPVDAGLLRQVGGGIFAFSGAAAGELAPVEADSHAVLLSNDQLTSSGGNPFVRSSARPAPFNLYASTAALYSAGYARGAAHRPPPAVFTYASATPPAARPATTASMSFSASSTRSWRWDPAQRVWSRSENGAADTQASGQRVIATNVVIMSVVTRGIPGLVDSAGNNDQDITLTGSGTCWVLRDGTVTAGRWTRASIADVGRLTDAAGRTIALRPGRTWIELLPSPHQPSL
jgi:hypothetical protein